MLPFSKRPPPPEEYFLRSGDFEAVRQDCQDPYAHAQYAHVPHAPQASPHVIPAVIPPVIPPAPRAPVFARQAAQTPYGFGQQQQQRNAFGQYGDLAAPPPPHSLAPVAMGAMGAMGGPDSTGRHLASTGTHRTQGSLIVREKPSLKWGVMIALSGALLGGVLGLGMDAHRQTARAAAAAEANDAAPAMVAAALPQALPQVAAPRAVLAAPVIPAPVAAPVAPGPVAPAAPPAPAAHVALAPAAQAVVAQPSAVLAPAQPVVVTPPKLQANVAAHTTKAAPVKPHGLLATKVTQPKPAAEPKAEAPEKPEPKIVKADPKPEPKAVKKDASTTDAMKILEAANKDTVNTL